MLELTLRLEGPVNEEIVGASESDLLTTIFCVALELLPAPSLAVAVNVTVVLPQP